MKLDREFARDAWAIGLALLAAIGVIATAIYSYSVGSGDAFILCIVTAGASTSVGFLLGFLFGIPRYLQSSEATNLNSDNASGKSDPHRIAAIPSVRYTANTNLEQISDWLTKILVGVGLTQLPSAAGGVKAIGEFVVAGSSVPGLLPQVFSLISVYFLIISFLFFYLWTRLFLGGQLAHAELGMFAEKLTEISEKADSAKEQFERIARDIEVQTKDDARALNIVNLFLTVEQSDKIDVNELKELVTRASAPVRVQIFYRARQVRSDNWADPEKRRWVERTIPIFEALIGSDGEGRFHQNHANLGFALKDKRSPTDEDLERAIEEMSAAIRIRGTATANGNELYEFVRAICKIRRDQDYRMGRQSSPEARASIKRDLLVARRIFPDFNTDSDVMHWLEINGISDLSGEEKKASRKNRLAQK